MNLPGSLYEALIQGFAGTGEPGNRRSLFLFLVDHSEAMQKKFPDTGLSRLASVTEALNEMKSEMARVDRGSHLDIGFMGYPVLNRDRAAASLWSNGNGAGIIRSVTDQARIEAGTLDPTSMDGAHQAFNSAQDLISGWVRENANPLYNPIVVHVIASERDTAPDLEKTAEALTGTNETCLFHCCFHERSPDNICVPRPDEVPSGLASQMYDVSSEMPPLVRDVGELLQGRISPGLRRMGEELARSQGVPRGLASLGADILGGVLGSGVRLPTGSPGTSFTINAKVDGLRINSSKGFALIKGMIGFKIFTQLFN